MKKDTNTTVEKCPTLAEVALSYKTKIKVSEMPKICSSTDIAAHLRTIWSQDLEYREEFMIILLNRANRILGWTKISSGGVAGTVADPKMIFQAGLLANASAIILAHNHPSGQLKPSGADIDLTQKLVKAGKTLDLPILDHVILTADEYYSFADEGLI